MADDPRWRWAATRPDGGVTVDAVDIDMPETTPGADLTLSLNFWNRRASRVRATGGTLGTATGFTVGGAQAATLGSGASGVGHRDRYLDVRRYAQVAGRVSTQTVLDGAVRYRPRLPADAPVDRVAIALRPSVALQDEATPGLWVLLNGVDDSTRYIQDQAVIDFDATVLDTLDRYPTRDQLENALRY